ncbi:hypothetical protein [Lignipirellula cremea]|uniref:SLA1 homology domain-containing protein n=1 Tax=Lignipirellula cremea TaxID=2528010 RepID=A0A518DNQ5_9BACT|nr:hypothetical protein [Lignipirellula cremea]QDU93468.1 hypothetical protein Pla8534_12480 [Lignipirellula cremea]
MKVSESLSLASFFLAGLVASMGVAAPPADVEAPPTAAPAIDPAVNPAPATPAAADTPLEAAQRFQQEMEAYQKLVQAQQAQMHAQMQRMAEQGGFPAPGLGVPPAGAFGPAFPQMPGAPPFPPLPQMAMPQHPAIPQPLRGAAPLMSSYSSRSATASSWSQANGDFEYRETIRGLSVKLTGKVDGLKLDVKTIEVDSKDGAKARFAELKDLPAQYQDEVKLAMENAAQYIGH